MENQYFNGTICTENKEKICKITVSLTQDGRFERIYLNLLSEKSPFKDNSKPLCESFAAKIIENRFYKTDDEVSHLPFIKTQFNGIVFENLLKIPYGKTKTYKELAAICGNEKASRAVGNAMRNNPLAIIYPCHRVVGTNGFGGGYCGNSKEYLKIKEKFISMEKQGERIKIL
jgi:O-6-methylguanine DNA methyltransferase